MKSFASFVLESSANTDESVINEIAVAYFLVGKDWSKVEPAAKKRFDLAKQTVDPTVYNTKFAQAEHMAAGFITWAKRKGYSGKVKNVYWTGRSPSSMTEILGYKVDQSKNPTDILVKFTSGPQDGYLGLSAKATKGKTDIGFKNPGAGTIDAAIGTKMTEKFQNTLAALINKLKLPKSSAERKIFIRANPEINALTIAAGDKLVNELRGDMLKRLNTLDADARRVHIVSNWLNAEEMLPPYVKVTGKGNKAPYTVSVEDPLENEKLTAVSEGDITFTPVGDNGIGVSADGKKILKMRLKFESEKMASSLKLSGESW